MDRLYFLRSFGDFIVAISRIRATDRGKDLHMVASAHLMPLYDALCELKVVGPLKNICFEDFGIRHNIMGCLTNKHLLELGSLRELLNLRNSLKQKMGASDHVYFEQLRRMKLLTVFTGIHNARFVHDGNRNVYESYDFFFGNGSPSGPRPTEAIRENTRNILITPGSRKVSKALPVNIVARLKQHLEERGFSVSVAGLPGELARYNGTTSAYTDFTELIQLLQKTDLVISADSLPVHLAELMNKPHWVLYGGQINQPWLTPSAAVNGRFSTFGEWRKILDFI